MQIFQNLNIFFPEFSIKIFSILLIKVFVSIFETNNLHIRPYLSSSIWVKTLSALFSESYVSKYPHTGTWPLLPTNYACNICVYVVLCALLKYFSFQFYRLGIRLRLIRKRRLRITSLRRQRRRMFSMRIHTSPCLPSGANSQPHLSTSQLC